MQFARPAVRPARRLSAVAAATLGVAALAAASAPALAQAAAGTKVGVVNVAILSGKIQELKDFYARIQKNGHQMCFAVLCREVKWTQAVIMSATVDSKPVVLKK